MSRISMERNNDLRALRLTKAAGAFSPLPLVHLYVRLEFEHRFEVARTAEDARGFLRSVARAALAAAHLASEFEGALMEVQGSVLHIALPSSGDDLAVARFAADLHWAYRALFNGPNARVHGWRMASDQGNTMVVRGRGVHGDDSLVSLGRAANRPAKHLFAQMELPEEDRQLKRFSLGVRDVGTGAWRHRRLEDLPSRMHKAQAAAHKATMSDPTIDFTRPTAMSGARAGAAPIGPAGSPQSPSADRPQAYFGWVMRADLDGFTARVDGCFDDDLRLQELARDFYAIMEAAAEFVGRHRESLVQLPWAGDNFTAAALFASKAEYDAAIARRLVELSLDFEKDMGGITAIAQLRGWAHGVAGGASHGNASGNVFIGAVIVDGRRFLVGAGEGIGRSAQTFGDINPQASEIVLYEPDWDRLDAPYRKAFEKAVTVRGEQSTLYRAAAMSGLLRVRAREASASATTIVTLATNRPQPVVSRPYFA